MIWTVLGSQGVIGSHLVSYLNSLGHTVGLPPRDFDGIYNTHLGHVIYAVGLTADFRNRPFDTVEAHINLVSGVLQRADFDSFLYLSSTRVYARSESGREGCLLPVAPLDPSDLYNISKLMGESICLQDARRAVRVARLSNVVGGNDIDTDNFIPSLIRAARGGRIVLESSLDSSKDYVHIDDVADLVTSIAVRGRERLYNVASGCAITHSEWTGEIAMRTGCIVDVVSDAPRVCFVPIDIARVKSEFGFQPRSAINALARYFQHKGPASD